jgi:hypothetical protein
MNGTAGCAAGTATQVDMSGGGDSASGTPNGVGYYSADFNNFREGGPYTVTARITCSGIGGERNYTSGFSLQRPAVGDWVWQSFFG